MNEPSESEQRIAALEETVRRLESRVSEFTGSEAQRVPRAVEAPSVSQATRRRTYVTEGAAGVADTVNIVLKNAADAYVVVQIAP